MKRFFLLVILCATMVVLGFILFLPKHVAKAPEFEIEKTDSILKPLLITTASGNPVNFLVEIADSDDARVRGLSGRDSLPEGVGMFFVFEKADRWGIWMKDMLFPIDIIWIGEDMRVVHVAHNATPASFPTIFTPPQNALYVLEIPAGAASKSGINVGDHAVI